MSKWGVTLNATLSDEQMDEIASKTVDKVLSSRTYEDKQITYLEGVVKREKERNRELEKMVVQREIIIDRYKTSMIRLKEECGCDRV